MHLSLESSNKKHIAAVLSCILEEPLSSDSLYLASFAVDDSGVCKMTVDIAGVEPATA